MSAIGAGVIVGVGVAALVVLVVGFLDALAGGR
jgi:hypothetical protein